MASHRKPRNGLNHILLVVETALESAKKEGYLLPEGLEALKPGMTVETDSAFEKKLKYSDCKDETKKLLEKMDAAGWQNIAKMLFDHLKERKDMFPRINNMVRDENIDLVQVERVLESYHWFIAIQLDNEIAGWASAKVAAT